MIQIEEEEIEEMIHMCINVWSGSEELGVRYLAQGHIGSAKDPPPSKAPMD